MKRSTRLQSALRALIAGASIGASGAAAAAATDIADSPLSNSSSNAVKPNVLMVLDDSGSMGWMHAPDSVSSQRGQDCFANHLYNRIYYNPGYTYTPPVYADGTSYPNVSFTNAPNDGFNPYAGTTNLDSSFRAYDYGGNDRDSAQRAYYEELTGNGVSAGSCGGNNKYTKRTISTSSSQAQNFANWYSYYRTRMLMMRTASGRAFEQVDDDFRVGFATIHTEQMSESSSSDFLHVREFSFDNDNNGSSQKAKFFKKLYGENPNSSTPLRGALSTAGQYYANKARSQDEDPVQYSCQDNFVILSTDGYWNTGNEDNSGSDKFGPYRLDNDTEVGNQDGPSSNADRPLLDDWKSGGNSSAGRTGGNGLSNTLADIAYYYNRTDLRDASLNNCTGALGADVCSNNPAGVKGTNNPQKLVTYALGLGVDGTLEYTDDYPTATSGDFYDIRQGTRPWPNPISYDGGERIDDLWHAAVNGEGRYYSAGDPESLAAGLSDALVAITAEVGSSSAAASSNLEPVAGDNFIYVAKYETVTWTGELEAYEIDPDDGSVSDTRLWAAQPQLDAATWSSRPIYYFDSSATNKLRSFNYASMNAATKAYFNSRGDEMSQWADLTADLQSKANGGENLVNFLRGDSSLEGTAFRDREHRLGDIVHAVPVYVQKPPFSYADTGYDSFVSNNSSRGATVYVAANDGMLHAFNADNGQERWAYMPTRVLDRLFKLADKNYANLHEFYVDGAPIVVDIYDSAWKTILVGSLGKGGRGYYALDVTNPSAPKALWEFSHDDLGYSFGNPIITKRKSDGKWVVVVSSGYNNTAPGDGEGHLFVLDAASGALLTTLDTGTGSTATPSGLGKINAWVDSEADNSADRIYGGDLLGNLWRFDIDAGSVLKLGQAVDGSGNPQSITIKPELAQYVKGNTSYDLVFVGTGRYLGISDLSDHSTHSIYGVHDDGITERGILRGGSFVQQVLSETSIDGETVLTLTQNPVDWSSSNGWFIDFINAGERVNVDMQLQFNILTVAGNIPKEDACVSGGSSILYYIDLYTGSFLSSSEGVAGRSLGNVLTAGIKTVRLTGGNMVTIVTAADGSVATVDAPSASASAGSVRRTAWRELIAE